MNAHKGYHTRSFLPSYVYQEPTVCTACQPLPETAVSTTEVRAVDGATPDVEGMLLQPPQITNSEEKLGSQQGVALGRPLGKDVSPAGLPQASRWAQGWAWRVGLDSGTGLVGGGGRLGRAERKNKKRQEPGWHQESGPPPHKGQVEQGGGGAGAGVASPWPPPVLGFGFVEQTIQYDPGLRLG